MPVVCALAALVATTSAFSQEPAVDLVGVVKIQGTTIDRLGPGSKLENGSDSNQFGGLSALDYTGSGNRFLLLADRGAGDGAVSFPCRFHEAELTVNPESRSIQMDLVSTHLFASASDDPLVGSLEVHAQDLAKSSHTSWQAFDPEGIRRRADGSLLVSDEYGPRVVVANEDGKVISEVEIPEEYRLRAPRDGRYTQGIYPNRGLEGIAVTPSGKTTLIAIQSPLVQDAVIRDDKCLGINCRWLVLDRTGAPAQQLVYQLESVKTGVSEVLAVDENRFLVLERDSEVGSEAKVKRIFLVDISHATDVTSIPALPPQESPAGVVVIKKSLFLDLLDDRFGLGGENAAEKPEGLSWGAPLADGRRTLWVCCDNDFDADVASEIYCFAVSGL